MRFYTVPNAKEARRSVIWAIWLIGIFYLFTLVLGYGAAALVGPDTINGGPRQGATRPPRCWPCALGGPRSCSASSPRSPSPRSWPWSPV